MICCISKKQLYFIIILFIMFAQIAMGTNDGKAYHHVASIDPQYGIINVSGQLLSFNKVKTFLNAAFDNRVFDAKIKKLSQVTIKDGLSKEQCKLNLDLPFLIILLFSIFYQLSRTSSEKKGASFLRTYLPQ